MCNYFKKGDLVECLESFRDINKNEYYTIAKDQNHRSIIFLENLPGMYPAIFFKKITKANIDWSKVKAGTFVYVSVDSKTYVSKKFSHYDISSKDICVFTTENSQESNLKTEGVEEASLDKTVRLDPQFCDVYPPGRDHKIIFTETTKPSHANQFSNSRDTLTIGDYKLIQDLKDSEIIEEDDVELEESEMSDNFEERGDIQNSEKPSQTYMLGSLSIKEENILTDSYIYKGLRDCQLRFERLSENYLYNKSKKNLRKKWINCLIDFSVLLNSLIPENLYEERFNKKVK